MAKYRAAIFVDGCFWHRHAGCRYTTTPSTRPEFWQAKFEANIARDTAVRATLLDEGWRMATIWECALRKPDLVAAVTELLAVWLRSDKNQTEIGEKDAQLS
jgi:DNA mismatch endonuclease (patch repair protein)